MNFSDAKIKILYFFLYVHILKQNYNTFKWANSFLQFFFISNVVYHTKFEEKKNKTMSLEEEVDEQRLSIYYYFYYYYQVNCWNVEIINRLNEFHLTIGILYCVYVCVCVCANKVNINVKNNVNFNFNIQSIQSSWAIQ